MSMRMEARASAPIPILSYHQTDALPAPGLPWRTLVTPPALFGRQMRALARRGWRGLSLRDLGPYLRGERRGKVFGLTFDDGFRSNLVHALPVVAEHGFTATVLVVSQAIGGGNHWDVSGGAPVKPMMTRPELLAWQGAGMEVGAHTQHHVDLTACDAQTAAAEISGCKRTLEALMDLEVLSFAFPYGRYRQEHLEMLRGAGYRYGVTCESRRAGNGSDPLCLPRITPWSDAPMPWFLAKVTTGVEDWRRDLSGGLRKVPAPGAGSREGTRPTPGPLDGTTAGPRT